jgi:FkbM family methyltransferase
MTFRKILNRIRRVKAINYPVRNIIKGFGKFSNSLYPRLNGRWPVSGVVNCKYEDIKFKAYNRCDDSQVNYYYYGNPYHEFPIIKLMCAFARRSKTILDIGANTGIHSVIVSKMNPDTKIYAIEPYQTNYIRLEKNLFINNCSNVEVKRIALGEKEDTINFYIPVDNSITDVSSAVENHGIRIYEDQVKWKKANVKQSTLNKLAEEIKQIDFFKCDVESYEVNVFKGAADFFTANKPPFVLEICLDDEKVSFFNEFSKKFGYSIYFVSVDGLVKLDKLYVFDRWPNFLFTQYNSANNYIPFKDLEAFADMACSNNTITMNELIN